MSYLVYTSSISANVMFNSTINKTHVVVNDATSRLAINNDCEV